jgi:hypothetical protein
MGPIVAEASTSGICGLLGAVVWDRKSSVVSMASSSSGCTRKEGDGMCNGGSSGYS